MTDAYQVVSGKFTFRIPADRQYTAEGVWMLSQADGSVRLGLSDYIQQRSGDAAFAEVKPAGTRLRVGDEFATLETIKVSISFSSPLAGLVVQTNPMLESAPEVINSDPYGEGWLAVLAPEQSDPSTALLSAQDYTQLVERQSQEAA